MTRARVALLLVLLVCTGMTVRQIHRPQLSDFEVYDTAGALVWQHQSNHLYDGADTGEDPQQKMADPATGFGRAAGRLGLAGVRMYVYPPILADLIVPFSWLPAASAGKAWIAGNLAALVLAAWLMTLLLGLRWRSFGALAILVGLVFSLPTVTCLAWGQISILLLLLWVAGIFFYRRGWLIASAFVLGLAAAIKLAPLVVLLPMLAWRDWRWLRAFAASLLVLIVLMLGINGPAPLVDYFVHVAPSMSRGIPDLENKSLVSAAQLLVVAIEGGSLKPVTLSVPGIVGNAAREFSLGVVLFAGLLLLQPGMRTRLDDRVVALALFALLSTAVAPVSWKHAYVVGLPALVFLWREALTAKRTTASLVVLSLGSLELGSFLFDSAAIKTAHGPALGLAMLLAPGTGMLLVTDWLWRMRRAGRVTA